MSILQKDVCFQRIGNRKTIKGVIFPIWPSIYSQRPVLFNSYLLQRRSQVNRRDSSTLTQEGISSMRSPRASVFKGPKLPTILTNGLTILFTVNTLQNLLGDILRNTFLNSIRALCCTYYISKTMYWLFDNISVIPVGY